MFDKPSTLVNVTKPKEPDLGASEKIMLLRECRKIADSFFDQKQNAAMIRFRITAMAQELDPEKRAWVAGWVERNIDPL